MKRIVAFLLCLLLIGSVAGEVGWVRAAEEPQIEITGYSAAASAAVPNVFEVSLRLRWLGALGTLNSLSIKIRDGNFQRAVGNDAYGYTISTEAIVIDAVKSLSEGKEVQIGFNIIKVGIEDKLKPTFVVNGVDDDNTDAIPVIKTKPDLPDPWQPTPDPVPVDTTKYRPSLGVATDSALPLLDQTTEELVIPIVNTAIYSANKITVTMEPTDKNKPLFTANRISVSAAINTLSRDQVKDAKFAVKLAPGATTGIHEVTLKYTFSNNHGDRFPPESETVYIQVENRNAAPRLSTTSSQWLTPGQQSQVKFTLTNSGTTAARNVKVTLEGLDPSGVSVINDIDVKYVDLVEGGGRAEVVYNLLPAHTLDGSSTRLQLKVDYSDTNGETYSATNAVFLPLYGATSEDKGVPRLIISKYSFSPQEIRAGSHFLLDLDLQNTSRSKTITNLKVTIISEEGVFLPIDASNTLFIESIAPGEIVPASLTLSAKADAENKPYPLRITFEYEDSQSTGHNSQEMISIPVHQNSRLVVGDIMLYGDPMLHDMVPVNIEFYNLGKTILYNLMVKAEGPFRLEGGSYFVGNFNPGANDSFNFAVIPLEPGEQIGAVVFQFEDSIGTPLEVRRELKLNVMEPYYPQDPGTDIPMPPPPTSKWKYVGIGAGFLVVAIAGFFFWRLRKKKKKLALQRAQDYTAAAQAVVPEIEYVGFEDEPQPNKSDPNR